MTANSKIEWTDHTFNPWIGCARVSPACDHCYAEAMMDHRMHKVRWGAGQPRVRTSTANWRQPLHWNAQAAREGRRFRVFCASLADVFDNEVPAGWRADLFALIRSTPNLDWLLLTKRIGNAHTMMVMAGAYVMYMRPYSDPEPSERWRIEQPLPNVWLGATVVDQKEADRDIPKLLATPAAVRFLSIEPMLGPIDLRQLRGFSSGCTPQTHDCLAGHSSDTPWGYVRDNRHDPFSRGKVDWVIVGGESGQQARPMHPEWARSLRDQCVAAGVPFFFKQWGEWAPCETEFDAGDYGRTIHPHEETVADAMALIERGFSVTAAHGCEFFRAGKKLAGRHLDGRTWDEVPRR